MGKIEDCVSQKLSAHLSPGQSPSDQDLAIKFSECRDQENIGDEIHKKMFGEHLVMEKATEGKNTVLGMAYNFYDRIFVDDKAIADGGSFDNKFTQEAMKSIEIILNDWPHTRITKEFLLLKMSQAGLDPVKSMEFLQNNIQFDADLLDKRSDEQKLNAPQLSEIPPTSHDNDDGTTVPNMNSDTDFEPEDTLFGGKKREDALDDAGRVNERIHHVAHSTVNHTPASGIELGPCEPGFLVNPVTGQCDPTDFPEQVNDTVDTEPFFMPPPMMEAPQQMEQLGRQGRPIRIPITEKAKESEGWKSEPTWLKKAHEGCGCENATAEAIKTLYGKDPRI